MTDYDRDPAAIAWARAHVQGYLDRLTEFEQRAITDDNPIVTYSCQVAAALARKHFLGDDTTLGAFDTRRTVVEDETR
ncbi:hypothetical protein ACFUJU_13620 [Streptomyces sp. NPDC057235]|uniref:hypothetical protein n=1 Tax=Streptomyces sp. NPDC057235 TaxID=3346058 RepID=UPI0036350834